MATPASEMTAHYELVPGTVHLIDLNNQMNVQHEGKRDIILVPQPSDDPTDPLRWPQWKKHQALAVLGIYGLITAAISGYTTPAIPEIIFEVGITYNDLSNAAAVQVLMAGWGNVWFTPISHKLGRRFVYLLSLAIIIVAQIITLYMSNRSMYLAAAFLNGLGISPFEALIEVSISDIYFAHERGSKLGIYILSIAGGSFLGPLAAGYVAVNMGWRWIIKWGLILSGLLWIAMFFLLPETRFVRNPSNNEIEFDEAAQTQNSVTGFTSNEDGKMAGNPTVSEEGDDTPTTKQNESFGDSRVSSPKSWYSSYALWTVFPGTWSDFVTEVIRPFRIMWFPLIFWSGIVYGSCVCWLSVQAVTIASIFAAPPYLFASDKIGLLALAPLVGTIFGAFYAGFLTNTWVLRMSRRNSGFREPEFRLYSLIPGAFFIGGGLIMYGVGAAYGVHWMLPAAGSAFIAVGLATGGTVMMGFIIDCYKEIAPEAITCVIVIRNTMGFAITFGTIDWVQNQGLQNTFIVMGVLAFAIFMSSIIFIIFGKKLRKLTTKSYLKFAAVVRG